MAVNKTIAEEILNIHNGRIGNYIYLKFGKKLLVKFNNLYKTRIGNYFYFKLAERVFDKTPHGPQIIFLEPTNICNSNCTFCPRELLTRPKDIMSFDTFKKIVHDIKAMNDAHKGTMKVISFSTFGEPLIDKNIFEKIRYAKKQLNDVSIEIYTNGSLINEENAKNIIESGTDLVKISFEGFSKELYEKIRVGLKFDIVKKNIIRLCKMVEGTKTEVVMPVVMEKKYEKFEEEFVKYWKSKVSKVYITKIHNWGGDYGEYLKEKPVVCGNFWNQMSIHWNGDVLTCCHDFDGKIKLGNVKDHSLTEFWNGQKYNTLRQMMLAGNKDKIKICDGCDNPHRSPVTDALMFKLRYG